MAQSRRVLLKRRSTVNRCRACIRMNVQESSGWDDAIHGTMSETYLSTICTSILHSEVCILPFAA